MLTSSFRATASSLQSSPLSKSVWAPCNVQQSQLHTERSWRGAMSRQTFLNKPERGVCYHLSIFQYSDVGVLKRSQYQLRHLIIWKKLSDLFNDIHKFCSVSELQIPIQNLKNSIRWVLAFFFPFQTAFRRIRKQNRCSIASNSLVLFFWKSELETYHITSVLNKNYRVSWIA